MPSSLRELVDQLLRRARPGDQLEAFHDHAGTIGQARPGSWTRQLLDAAHGKGWIET